MRCPTNQLPVCKKGSDTWFTGRCNTGISEIGSRGRSDNWTALGLKVALTLGQQVRLTLSPHEGSKLGLLVGLTLGVEVVLALGLEVARTLCPQ